MHWTRILLGVAAGCALAACASVPQQPVRPVVGVSEIVVAAPERADPVTGKPREFWVRLYYAASSADESDPYVPAATAARLALDGYYDQPRDRIEGWAKTRGPAVADAVASQGPDRPLLVLLPGLGVSAAHYSRLAAALVAKGYAVAVVELPYATIGFGPDGVWREPSQDSLLSSSDQSEWGQRFSEWSRDAIDAIDAVAAEASRRGIPVDTARTILAGHSVGGAVAFEACPEDRRIRVCADFEGAPFGTRIEAEGPRKPSLFVLSRSVTPERPLTTPDLVSPMFAFMARGSVPGWAVAVAGGSHMSFSDAPAEMPETLARFGGELMTPQRSLEVYTGMLDAFAEAYLDGGGGDVAFAKALSAISEARGSR